MADGSLSQFKATLARKLERTQKRQERSDRNMSYKSSVSKPEFDFPKLSESELEKVKSNIRNKLKSERKKTFISIAIISVLIIIVLLLILI